MSSEKIDKPVTLKETLAGITQSIESLPDPEKIKALMGLLYGFETRERPTTERHEARHIIRGTENTRENV